MTLHEAMIKAINELGGGKQHIQDVTDYINTHRFIFRGVTMLYYLSIR